MGRDYNALRVRRNPPGLGLSLSRYWRTILGTFSGQGKGVVEDLLTNIGLTSEDLGSWATNIVFAILIFVIGRWVAKWLTGLSIKAMERGGMDHTLSNFLRSIIFMTLLVMVVLAAVDRLGVPTTNFLAILGAAGLAVGLALKDSLSNFSAGVMLIFFRPFRVGDFIDAGGVSGTVNAITIFNTILRTPDNRVITVPNGQIYDGTITNFSAMSTRRIDLVIGIGYDDNVVKAKEILQSILEDDDRILNDPAPVVMMLELADSSVNFAVRPWVVSADYWAVRADVLERSKQTLEDAGLSIPYPQRDIHLIGQVPATG
jgi:small conductance mechanosensitive channel